MIAQALDSSPGVRFAESLKRCHTLAQNIVVARTTHLTSEDGEEKGAAAASFYATIRELVDHADDLAQKVLTLELQAAQRKP